MAGEARRKPEETQQFPKTSPAGTVIMIFARDRADSGEGPGRGNCDEGLSETYSNRQHDSKPLRATTLLNLCEWLAERNAITVALLPQE